MNTYALWWQSAENLIEEITRLRLDYTIVEVDVDADEYIAWCRSTEQKLNAGSRNKFGSMKATEMGLEQD